jgi:transcription initiation factor TFIIB
MMTIDVDDPLWNMQHLHSTQHSTNDEEEQQHQKQPQCPYCDCDSAALVPLEGGLTCQRCNTVVQRQLDYGAEWRYYGAEDVRSTNMTRCCPPSNGLITALGSVVSCAPRRRASQWSNRTADRAAASNASQAAGRQLQRYQVWSALSYRERVLCGIFEQLTVNAAHHGLPACILEDAKNLYKAISDRHITRGENRAAVIATSVYVACRRCGVPRSIREIAEMFDLKPAAITRAFRTFRSVVGDADEDAEPTTPMDFVGRFCTRLSLAPEATEAIREVVRLADEAAAVSEAMPPSIVAGAIALVAERLGLKLAREDVAAVCAVAPATVAKMQRRLAAF